MTDEEKAMQARNIMILDREIERLDGEIRRHQGIREGVLIAKRIYEQADDPQPAPSRAGGGE